MTEHLLTLDQIVSWYRSKQRSLAASDISVVSIKDRVDQLPAAAVDFSGPDTMGRINGWVSGEFDFEAVRVSDGADLFWQHVKIATMDDLETVFRDFIQHLSPGADAES